MDFAMGSMATPPVVSDLGNDRSAGCLHYATSNFRMPFDYRCEAFVNGTSRSDHTPAAQPAFHSFIYQTEALNSGDKRTHRTRANEASTNHPTPTDLNRNTDAGTTARFTIISHHLNPRSVVNPIVVQIR